MRIAQLSDAIIPVTITGVPTGRTVSSVKLALKLNDASTDASSLVVSATPSAGVATFNITDVQTGALSVKTYKLSAKAILDDGKAIRLELDDNIVEITPPGIEAVT